MGLIIFVLIGLIAGAIATRAMGHRTDLATSFLIGVLGALLGGLLAWSVGLHATGILGKIIIATAGAVICLYLWQRSERPN